MSTTPIDSWTQAPLESLGPIYPFVGTEMAWFVVGIVAWIGWHVLQVRMENRSTETIRRRLHDREALRTAVRNGHESLVQLKAEQKR